LDAARAGERERRGSGVSENESPIEKAVELLVYAPIGLAMFAKDTVPTFMKMFVARGQTEVTQRRKSAGTQAGNYKTIGQMAVKYGGPEVKRQAGAAAETVRRRAEETLTTIATAAAAPPAPAAAPRPAPGAPRPSSAAPVTTTPSAPRSTGDAGTATVSPPGELPIPGYDLLSATQVIERLEGLARPELSAVKAYELAHRARTTILGKIAQLAP
jgi:hypothetical protein